MVEVAELKSVAVNGVDLAYTDFVGIGRPVVALHGSFGRGAVFTRLAGDLASSAHVIAPDQRGHGYSSHTDSYTDADFVADIAGLVRHLDLGPVVVLGHSRGGITAYQLAARHPELVAALIIEDVGPLMRSPEIEHPVLDVLGWPETAATKMSWPTRFERGAFPNPVISCRVLYLRRMVDGGCCSTGTR
ncbi:alpha/beta fold hydrolase [Nocardia testacea]|uniref:alpha/beta fold hydrolase n=1 Tax=Nocardia testacea TaxID=248551 RepID=UPI003A8740CB